MSHYPGCSNCIYNIQANIRKSKTQWERTAGSIMEGQNPLYGMYHQFEVVANNRSGQHRAINNGSTRVAKGNYYISQNPRYRLSKEDSAKQYITEGCSPEVFQMQTDKQAMDNSPGGEKILGTTPEISVQESAVLKYCTRASQASPSVKEKPELVLTDYQAQSNILWILFIHVNYKYAHIYIILIFLMHDWLS